MAKILQCGNPIAHRSLWHSHNIGVRPAIAFDKKIAVLIDVIRTRTIKRPRALQILVDNIFAERFEADRRRLNPRLGFVLRAAESEAGENNLRVTGERPQEVRRLVQVFRLADKPPPEPDKRISRDDGRGRMADAADGRFRKRVRDDRLNGVVIVMDFLCVRRMDPELYAETLEYLLPS